MPDPTPVTLDPHLKPSELPDAPPPDTYPDPPQTPIDLGLPESYIPQADGGERSRQILDDAERRFDQDGGVRDE